MRCRPRLAASRQNTHFFLLFPFRKTPFSLQLPSFSCTTDPLPGGLVIQTTPNLFFSPVPLGLCSSCSARRERVFAVGSDGRYHLRSQSVSTPNVRNFGRSLLAGYCPTYMPDLVLHGTGSDEKLKQCLAADLVHTVQVSDASWSPRAADRGGAGGGGGQGCAWQRVRSRDCRWRCRQGCRNRRGW